tara:strand:- start:693 stop:926 length:234 start_codon:yes stop_codon:yes gene_type:complete
MTKKISRPFIATKDPMVRDILQRMSDRSDEGLTKYKVNMEMAKKPFSKWIDDVQEEAWDMIVYLEKVRQVLKKSKII